MHSCRSAEHHGGVPTRSSPCKTGLRRLAPLSARARERLCPEVHAHRHTVPRCMHWGQAQAQAPPHAARHREYWGVRSFGRAGQPGMHGTLPH